MHETTFREWRNFDRTTENQVGLAKETVFDINPFDAQDHGIM